MGATPILALAIVGMPLDKLAPAVIGQILEGGASVCRAAGIPIAGGHSIDVLEPIYGLVALGVVHPDKILRNDAARAGDVLILGKPLGVGVLSAALKKGRLSDAGYAAMIAHTTRLNTPGPALAGIDGVHAVTDVTGFGLAGHLLEVCRGSGVAAQLRFGDMPVIDEAADFAREGLATGASKRNWAAYGDAVAVEALEEWQRVLLTDPQTSGGLLVSCAPKAVEAVLAVFAADGFGEAAVIGELVAGAPRIQVI